MLLNHVVFFFPDELSSIYQQQADEKYLPPILTRPWIPTGNTAATFMIYYYVPETWSNLLQLHGIVSTSLVCVSRNFRLQTVFQLITTGMQELQKTFQCLTQCIWLIHTYFLVIFNYTKKCINSIQDSHCCHCFVVTALLIWSSLDHLVKRHCLHVIKQNHP